MFSAFKTYGRKVHIVIFIKYENIIKKNLHLLFELGVVKKLLNPIVFLVFYTKFIVKTSRPFLSCNATVSLFSLSLVIHRTLLILS